MKDNPPPRSQKRSKRPPEIPRQDIKDKEGFLLNKEDRQILIKKFSENTNLNLLKKNDYNVFSGRMLPYDVIRDSNNNIFVIHDRILGEGAFGVVRIAQAISVSDSAWIQEGKYYAVKIQKVEKGENNLVETENAIAQLLGLNVGDLVHTGRKNARYYFVMPLIVGSEMGQLITSYGEYKPSEDVFILHDNELKNLFRIAKAQSTFVSDTQQDLDELRSTDTIIVNEDEEELEELRSTETIIVNEDEEELEELRSTDTIIVNEDEEELEELRSTDTIIVNEDEEPDDLDKKARDEEDAKELHEELKTTDTILVYEDLIRAYSLTEDIKEKDKGKTKENIEDLNEYTAGMESGETYNSPDLLRYQTAIPEIEPLMDVKGFDVNNWLSLFQELSAQVANTHQRGIVHLDIKPENFMLNPGTGEAVLIDFGISQKIEDISTTPRDFIIGTPSFMAPEFISGNYHELLSTKQDIYSLGRTFELLFERKMVKLSGREYELRLPLRDVNIPYSLKDFFITPHLEEFHFSDRLSDPEFTAINNLMDLIHEMENPDPSMRPEAAEVNQKLHAIQAPLKVNQERVDLKNKLINIIMQVDLDNSETDPELQARIAIDQYNNQLDKSGEVLKSQKGEMHAKIEVSRKELVEALQEAKKLQIQAKAKKRYFATMQESSYHFNVGLKKILTQEILELQTKKSAFPDTSSEQMKKIDKLLKNKNLQLKQVEIEIRTYERKHEDVGAEKSTKNKRKELVLIEQFIKQLEQIPLSPLKNPTTRKGERASVIYREKIESEEDSDKQKLEKFRDLMIEKAKNLYNEIKDDKDLGQRECFYKIAKLAEFVFDENISLHQGQPQSKFQKKINAICLEAIALCQENLPKGRLI